MARPSLPDEIRSKLEKNGFVRPTPCPSVDQFQRMIAKRGGEVTVTARASGLNHASVSLTGIEFDAIADDPGLAIAYALSAATASIAPMLPGFEPVETTYPDLEPIAAENGSPAIETPDDLPPDLIVTIMSDEGLDIVLAPDGSFVDSAGQLIDDDRMTYVRFEAFKCLSRLRRSAAERAAAAIPDEPVDELGRQLKSATDAVLYADAGPDGEPAPDPEIPDADPETEPKPRRRRTAKPETAVAE